LDILGARETLTSQMQLRKNPSLHGLADMSRNCITLHRTAGNYIPNIKIKERIYGNNLCAKKWQFILIKRGRRQGEGLYDSCNIVRHSWWTPTTEIQFRKTNANKRKDTHTHIGIHADKPMQKHLQESTKENLRN
jgi:hypothetical protein